MLLQGEEVRRLQENCHMMKILLILDNFKPFAVIKKYDLMRRKLGTTQSHVLR